MDTLEKILEEIKAASRKMVTAEVSHKYYRAIGTRKVEKIIRRHLEGKDIGAPENSRWIPVEERLPTTEEQKKDDGDFEITIWNEYRKGNPFVSRGYFNGREFELQEKDYSAFAEVIAWQPLPEPYREVEQEWKDNFRRRFEKVK